MPRRKQPAIQDKRQETLRLLELAEEGRADAQNFLAARLAQGYFVKLNERGALYWYAQAMKLGYVESMWNAGTMLIAGEGVDTPAIKLGMSLVKRAAESGVTSACLFLSQLSTNGLRGFPIDADVANYWRERAYGNVEYVEYSSGIDIGAHGIQLIKPELEFEPEH